MDLIPSMFEFDLTNELFQTFSYPCRCQPYSPQQEETQLLSPTQLVDEQLNSDNKPASGGRHRRPCKASKVSDEMNDDCHAQTKKKILHRDIERQRRREMATLYASLRSELPLEYLKGKRSISDHMYQAVNYIKHLQKNIQGLSCKRDDQLLRNMTHYCHSDNTGSDNLQASTVLPDSLIVTPCSSGIKVVMNSAVTEGIPLSRVLRILIEEGLSIFSLLDFELIN